MKKLFFAMIMVIATVVVFIYAESAQTSTLFLISTAVSGVCFTLSVQLSFGAACKYYREKFTWLKDIFDAEANIVADMYGALSVLTSACSVLLLICFYISAATTIIISSKIQFPRHFELLGGLLVTGVLIVIIYKLAKRKMDPANEEI